MTLSSDAATDALWPPGAPVNSNCWNGYSPSSSLSSQPCSPGPTGGLVGHAEKNLRELAAMPFGAQESFLQNKRIRLNAETSARACMQVYSHIEGAVTSAQLACSVTPSPNTCGINSFLSASGGFPNFCSQLSSAYGGGCAPSSADHATQRAAGGSGPGVFNNYLASLAPPGMLLGSNSCAAVIEQPTSMPSWPSHQPQFQRLQQQLAQLVTEQPAPACTTTVSSLALTLALCDVHAANRQLAATGLAPQAAFQPCTAAGSGCVPALGGFPLPFIFTGAVPVAVNAPAPAAPAPAIHSHLQPLPCSLPVVLLDNGMLMNTAARASAVSMAGLPGAFNALSAAAAAAAAVGQTSHLRPLQQPVRLAAAVPQLKTPCLGYLSEPVRCTVLCADPRVADQSRQPPLQLKMGASLAQRVRPPSPLPPSMPMTPPQPGCLGAEDWILHVVKVLGMSEPDTARLALHCWRRVSELPQLHHAARLWSTTVVGRNIYATACLWVSIKLEEKRRAAPGGVVLAHLAATTPSALCSAELAVMNWLEWRPYDGYRLDESHLLVYM